MSSDIVYAGTAYQITLLNAYLWIDSMCLWAKHK